MNIPGNFYKDGFCFLDKCVDLSDYSNFFDNKEKVIGYSESRPMEPGYSAQLNMSEFNGLHSKCVNFANSLIENLPPKFMPRPRILGIHLMRSTFQENHSEIPTRAFLWHRDLDDWFYPQIKIMIPMVSTSRENGMFSVASKSCCDIGSSLLDTVDDPRVHKFADSSDSNVRVRDAVMRAKYSSGISDFRANPGDVCIVDTNSCYHAGGRVTSRDQYRINIQITIGSILHSWNKNSTLRNLSRKIASRSVLSDILFPGAYDNYRMLKDRANHKIILSDLL